MKNYRSLFSIVLAIIFFSGSSFFFFSEESNESQASTNNLTSMATTPTFIHTVFFWMKDELSSEDLSTYEEGLNALTTISYVKASWIGKPAGTDREVVDNSYDYALILHFSSKEDQDAYQVAPVHKTFVEKSAHTWEKVQVYDTWVE